MHQNVTDQRAPGQIKGTPPVLSGVLKSLLSALGNRQPGEVAMLHPPFIGAADHADGIPVLVQKNGSQALVPADDFGDRPLQGGGVQPSPDPDEARNIIVGIFRLQLVQEP